MGAVMRKAALAALGVLFLLLLGCNNPMLARLQELAGVTTQGVPSGPTVYVAGSLNNGTSPCYWVNGVKHDMALPSGASSCSVNSIVASNGTVYVAGTYFNGGKPYPCLWTNGAAQDLQLLAGASMGTANAIAGSAGQLCIAGSCTGASDIPCQWLNGAPSSLALPGGALGGSATSVSIYQAKPYIGGLYVNASSVLTFCYWPMGGGYKDLPLPGGRQHGGRAGRSHVDCHGLHSRLLRQRDRVYRLLLARHSRTQSYSARRQLRRKGFRDCGFRQLVYRGRILLEGRSRSVSLLLGGRSRQGSRHAGQHVRNCIFGVHLRRSHVHRRPEHGERGQPRLLLGERRAAGPARHERHRHVGIRAIAPGRSRTHSRCLPAPCSRPHALRLPARTPTRGR